MVDTIPTLAWSAHSDGSADFFNQCWLDYTGLSAEHALNWGWKIAIHPDDLARMLKSFQEAVDSGKPFEVEGRLRRSDGEFRWFLFRGNPLLDESGRVVKWYGTNTDLAFKSGGTSPGVIRSSHTDPHNHEKELIEAALADSKGKVAGPNGAAAKLGIPRSTLDFRIKQLNIKKHAFR